MKRLARGLAVTAAAFLLVSVGAQARAQAGAEERPLESLVPDDYDVTIRINISKALNAPELAKPRGLLQAPNIQQVVASVREFIGVDLLKDIDTFLLAGFFDGKRKKDQMFILQGRWNETGIVSALQTMQQYEKFDIGMETVHGFYSNNDNEMRYVAFVDLDVVAIGRRNGVETLIRRASEKGGRLIDHSGYASRVKAFPKDPLIAVAGVLPESAGKDKAGRALLKNIHAVSATVDLEKDVIVEANAELANARMVAHGKEIVEGLLAFLRLLDERPQIGELLDKVSLKTGATSLTASARASLDEILDAMRLAPNLRPVADMIQRGQVGGAAGGRTGGAPPAGF